VYTDTADAPWYVVGADKRRARSKMIAHLLSRTTRCGAPRSKRRPGLPRRPTSARHGSRTGQCPITANPYQLAGHT
jgi:hypothetical protein